MNNNPFQLDDKHILITGASGGLGRAITILVSEMGARVSLVGRNKEKLQETLSSMYGKGHVIYAKDINLEGELPQWMREVAANSGPLNGLVHAAGVQTIKPLKILDEENLRETMSINFNTAVALTRGFRHRAVSGAGGSIVFLSSVMGQAGQAGQVAYCASKGALISASKAMALELAREKIRVNCITPGLVDVGMVEKLSASISAEQFEAVKAMHPLGLGHPNDIAAAAVYLLSDAARWVTGTSLCVDGGYLAH